MQGWVRYARGRAIYDGRIARAPFAAWTETEEGRAAIESVRSRLRWSFLAAQRAKRRVWRQLAAVARDPSVVASIQSEIDAYLTRVRDFAYADGLPRSGVDLHRLVVVPRVLVNGAAYRGIATRLNAIDAFRSIDGGSALRDFFVLTLVQHVDAAVASARPSLKHPLAVGRDWVGVGLNPQFVWGIPVFKQPPWNGHYYVLELTRDPITRAVRKSVAAQIERIEGSLPGLSRSERNEILRRASVHA